MMMEAILAFLSDNFYFYVIACATLFFWDLMDLYVELRNFNFIWNNTFWAYYLVRVFFSLALLEIGFIIGLFTLQSKAVMAFVVPLSFSAILQNLVVKVGGVAKSINLGEVFDRFKFRINDALERKNVIAKVLRQRELLISSNVPNSTLLETCRFYADEKTGYDELVNKTKNMNDNEKRVEYIVWLADHAGNEDIASELIKQATRARKTV